MRVNEKMINDFQKLQDSLPEILQAYGINKTYVAHHAGMTRQTFYNKIKNKTFTASELLKVAKVINR